LGEDVFVDMHGHFHTTTDMASMPYFNHKVWYRCHNIKIQTLTIVIQGMPAISIMVVRPTVAQVSDLWPGEHRVDIRCRGDTTARSPWLQMENWSAGDLARERFAQMPRSSPRTFTPMLESVDRSIDGRTPGMTAACRDQIKSPAPFKRGARNK
jgi:hypothetical protein